MSAAPLPAVAATGGLVAHVSPATSFPGDVVVVSGSASAGDVTLQRLVGQRWQTVARAAVSSHHSYSLSVRAPGVVGRIDLRVLQGQAISKTLHVRVLTAAFTVSAAATADTYTDAPITVTGRVSPTAVGNVQLQRLVDGAWVTLASGALTTTGTYSVTTGQQVGLYGLRVVKSFTASRGNGVSDPFNVQVLPPAAPPVLPPGTPPVLPPAPVISTPIVLPAAVAGVAYDLTFDATGGTLPYTWTATSLPAGLQLSTDGQLTGTPTQVGPAVLVVTVSDAAGATTHTTFSLDVAAAPNTVSGWGSNTNGQFGDGIAPFRDTPARPLGATPIAAVASGLRTSYAVTTAGAVLAWGTGTVGQLGDGTTLSSSTPVAVSGLGSGVTAVSGAADGGYALKADGTVWAWGAGTSGQLGSGTSSSLIPVQVPGLTGVTAIASGNTDGYALKSDGTVWAWGVNQWGELGDGALDVPGHPVQVLGLPLPVTAIASGSDTGYALLNDGTVRAWGLNGNGQVGDGTTTNRPTALAVSGLTGVTAVAGETHGGLALLTDGTVRGWGTGQYAQLGSGTSQNVNRTPITIVGIAGATGLSASWNAGYVVLADQTVRAWGFLRFTGTQETKVFVPITRDGLPSVTSVIGGQGDTVFALAPGGVLWEWGPDQAGALDRNVPGRVDALGSATQIVADGSGAVALTSTGAVQDWGTNGSGQLGNNTTGADPTSPTLVPLPASAVSVGSTRTDPATRFAVMTDGSVMAWGANAGGTLGVSSGSVSVPQAVPSLTDIVAIAGGSGTAYALDAAGRVFAWGDNSRGELGDGTTVNRSGPALVSGLSGIVAIAAANSTGYALDSTGVVWAWGANDLGQVGNADDANGADVYLPVQVVSLGVTVAIGAGDDTGYAVQSDGTVRSWGTGGSGQLGDGNYSDVWTPEQVAGLTGVTAVAGGQSGGYALTGDGHVLAWGDNSHGQLGNDTTVSSPTPVQVSGLSGVIGLSAAGMSAFAAH